MDTHNKKSPFPDGKRDLFFLVNLFHKSHNGLERTAVQLPGLLEKAPQAFGTRISFIEKFLRCYLQIFADIKEPPHGGKGSSILNTIDIIIGLSYRK